MAIAGLLIRPRRSLVVLRGAGVLSVPDLALLSQPSLTALGVLLKTLLALSGLAFPIPGLGQLSFERPAVLSETLKPSQVAELVGELPGLAGGILSLPGRVLSVTERVLDLRVARQGGDHPRRQVTLSPRVLQLRGGLVALLASVL